MRELDAVVHDVRGALTVMSGQCFTLGRRSDPTLSTTLRSIEREIERVRAMLDGMAEGRESRRQVDVGALVREVGEANAPHAQRSDRHIAMFIEQGLFTLGCEARLRAAVENLVQNGIRHAPPQTAVMVRAVQADAAVAIEVIDEGVGVALADRARIFDAGDRGSRPIGRGSGLGLTIARDVAREHGGSLDLGETSVGATFRLLLPRYEEQA